MNKIYCISDRKEHGEFFFGVCDIHCQIYHSEKPYPTYREAITAAMKYINEHDLIASPNIYQYV